MFMILRLVDIKENPSNHFLTMHSKVHVVVVLSSEDVVTTPTSMNEVDDGE